MNDVPIIAALAVTFLAGTGLAKFLQRQRQQRQLAQRLAPFAAKENPLAGLTARIRESFGESKPSLLRNCSQSVNLTIAQAGMQTSLQSFIFITIILFLSPLAIASTFQLDALLALVIACLLAALPTGYLKFKRAQIRKTFVTQLPDAIDLMISVLRTGHSIPQAVKTVSEELPAPVGSEFKQVMQRMNLGQPLSQALIYSCEKFASFELDLIRRAATIQAETGGSLAELLEKTNSTLRQRLKLVRQVGVLTAQSKLTATVVSMLPFVMAATLQYLSPGYLEPLFQSGLGKLLLSGALVLMIIGAFLMRKMATVKV
jgi:tight adherence protein B